MEPGGQPPLDYTATVMAAIFFGCAGVLQVCWRPSQLARLLRPVARRPSPLPLSPTPYSHARSRTQVCAKCVIPTVSG